MNPVLQDFLTSVKDTAETYEECVILYNTIISVKPRLVIELGVNSGFSTVSMAHAVAEIDSRLVSVDIKDCPIAKSNIDHYKLNKFWSFSLCDSKFFLRRNENIVADMIFIDTDHTEPTTFTEIELSSKIISGAGSIFLHDTKSWQYPGVLSAIYKFLSLNPGFFFTEYNTRYGLGLLRKR